jgi:histidine ammonia-lyase
MPNSDVVDLLLEPGKLTLAQLRRVVRSPASVTLTPACAAAIRASADTVERIVAQGAPAYGINTGFGKLAKTHIPNRQLEELQRNLVLSHSAGVGRRLPTMSCA